MANIKVSVIGSGDVGEVLANGFLKHGYSVMRASRTPANLAEWKSSAGPNASTGDFKEAAVFGSLVVLAVKGSAAVEAIKLAGADALAGKTVIDTTNPIADAEPVNGVVQYFTGPNESLLERIQAAAPKAHVVKAFSCVGNALMVNPQFKGGVQGSMFICGNNDAAKASVREVLTQFGWETADMGAAQAARAIEPLCMLWCIPGFRENSWTHAFKLLK